jgi:hypothetical protein
MKNLISAQLIIFNIFILIAIIMFPKVLLIPIGVIVILILVFALKEILK